MNSDPEKFKHNRSAYERPNQKFRCGREKFWQKPCSQGPTEGGACGGVTECNPAKNEKGRYECKRPASAGGPCGDGPLPEGSCSRKHPPCVPLSSLRESRGRLAFLFVCVVIASLGSLHLISKYGTPSLSAVDPGPLS